MDSPASLTAAYHQHIPISAHMGMAVRDYTGTELIVTAPLADNINHQLTAFGGSLFAVAALAGWGLIQLKLSEMEIEANTVIADGDVAYRRPVKEELVCHCTLPADWDEAALKLKETGKMATTLSPVYRVGDETAMTFNGRYVVRGEKP